MAFYHQSNRRHQRGLARATSVSAATRKLSATNQNSTNLSGSNELNDKLSSSHEHQHLQESYSLAAPAASTASHSTNNNNQSSNINSLFANLFSSSSSTSSNTQQLFHSHQSKESENTIQLNQSSNANQNMLPPSTSTGAIGQVSDAQLTLRNNVSANSSQNNKQRQPMCPECEKSLPNQIVFDKIEAIIRLMQDEQTGVPVRTAKSFMSKIPSVFTGVDLIQWMMKNLKLDDQTEAHHLANLIASHGYIFPIEDHTLSIKNDCTFYRFQTPCLWPSNTNDPENTDYAVYLCKRTMQGRTRLELADYEAENLARLQKMFSRKWEFIFMQAESQAKVDKKRDKLERKVLDSQERAFWDVYRPVPGCVNTTEIDIKKACRLSKSSKGCPSCQKVASANSNNINNASSSSSTKLNSSPASTSPSITPNTDTISTNQVNSKVAPSSSSPLPQHDTSSASHLHLQQVTTKSVDINDIVPLITDQANQNPLSITESSGISETAISEQQASNKQQQALKEPHLEKSIEPLSPSASNSSSSCHHAHHHSHIHAHSHGHTHSHPHNHPHPHHHHHHHPCQHHHQHHQFHHRQHAHQHHSPATTNNPPINTCHAETIKTAVTATPNVASSLNVTSASQQRSMSPLSLTSDNNQSSDSATLQQQSSSNKESFLQQTAKRLSIGHHSIGGRKSIDSNMSTTHQQRQRIKSAAFVSADMDLSDETKTKSCGQPNLKMYESCDNPKTGQSDQNIDIHQHTHHHQDHHLSATSTKSLSSNTTCKLCEQSNFEAITIVPRRDSESHHRQRANITSNSLTTQHDGSISLSSESESGDPGPDSLTQLTSDQAKSIPTSNKTPLNVMNTKNSSSTMISASAQQQNIGNLEKELESLRIRLDRRIGGVKMSKVTQSYLSYFQQWAEYDPFITTPIPSNPWVTDSTELWDTERQTKDVHCRRIRRWAFSLKELLNDPAGRDQFFRFLEKEFSAENLKFWDAVQELKRVHSRDVPRRIEAIWNEYLATDANCPINIDSKSYETSKKNMEKNRSNRYIFDEAAGHVYQLMKNDSYPRYLRSDMYKDYKEASEKKRSNQVAFDVFKPQITTLKHKFNF